jgi:subtilisin family serine protease
VLGKNVVISGKILAYNAIEGDEMVQDSGFHGTHVAGLIAATSDNGVGGSGVLGKNVVIMPVRVSADGQSIDSQSLYNGLVWAADNGAQVVNLSLGGPSEMPLVRDGILYAVKKGAVVLVASGNNGKKLALPGNVILSNGKSYPYCPSIGAANYNDYSTCAIYPAVYGSQIDGMITVGSYDITSGQTSYFSNFSSDYVEILAPGSNGNGGILSTVPASLSSTGYASIFNGSPIQGTSMATPVASGAVAAAIALGQSRGYDMLPEQVEALLKLGSPNRAQFAGYSHNGRALNLKSLIDRLDSEMHLSITPATGVPASRATAWGMLKIATQPSRATVLAGLQTKLAVVMSADSSILRNYQWYRDGIALIGQNRAELVFDQVKTTDAGLYHVVIRAGTNQVISNRVPLNVGRAYCN